MGSKIFLDANVVLDFLLIREKHDVSKKIIAHVVAKDIQGFVTPAVVHIISYWLKKTYGGPKAKEMILTLLDDIQVIDCNHQITINALRSGMDDVEDALQYYTALHHKMDCFITLDKKLHKSAIPTLPVYYPEEFVTDFLL